MTIFAVICAGMFPGIHVGRPWLAYWLFPLPNQMDMWPQFRSPLLWDVFAVGTYFTVSLLFWYVGMIPDLATLRDRADDARSSRSPTASSPSAGPARSRHWHRFEKAYLLLAALATPLVLSVHSVVSFDFATSQVPGWHTTIFPPYFVAGAVFGGFAMVLTLAIPARQFFGLKDIITLRHIDNMSKVLLGTGLIVGYAYGVEFFIAWYSGVALRAVRVHEPRLRPVLVGVLDAWSFCNVVAPQLFWFKRLRSNLAVVMFVAHVRERRHVVRAVRDHRHLAAPRLPAGSWGMYMPTWVDLGMFAGSFGLFFTLFLLFCRFLPMVAMAEVKTVMPRGAPARRGRTSTVTASTTGRTSATRCRR